jgi:hypothetical protein
VRDNDPARNLEERFIKAWENAFKDNRKTIAQAITKAKSHADPVFKRSKYDEGGEYRGEEVIEDVKCSMCIITMFRQGN